MSFNLRLDLDPVIICPYDSNHRIAKSRIQRHLVKCEKNFPPNYKQQCPYDATHRLFEHEMIDHIINCPMKFTVHVNPIPERQPETEPTIEGSGDNDEVWEEDRAISTNQFLGPKYEAITATQYTTIISTRGNCAQPRRYGSILRRPFGYSESMMLDVSGEETEDDARSVSSDMGIGRGQFLHANRGQYIRGGRVLRRGFSRGRLLH